MSIKEETSYILNNMLFKNFFIRKCDKEVYFECLKIFLEFLDDERNVVRFNDILNDSKKIVSFSFLDRYLNQREKLFLLTVFLFKSFNPQKFNKKDYDVEDFCYLNSDSLINVFCEYINNFLIFFFNETHNFKNIRHETFKHVKYLVGYQLIEEKQIRRKNKTYVYWSLPLVGDLISIDELLDISLSPYKIINIDNNSYLIGNFFNQIYKIFTENLLSKEKFYLKDEFFLNKIKDNYLYVDEKKVLDILNIVQKTESNFTISIKEINKQSFFIKKKIKELNVDQKKEEIAKNLQISNFIKKSLTTLNFSYTFIPKHIEDIDKILLIKFFAWIGQENFEGKNVLSDSVEVIEKWNQILLEKYSSKSNRDGVYFLLDVLKLIKKKELIETLKKFKKKFNLNLNFETIVLEKKFNLDSYLNFNNFYFLKFLNESEIEGLNNLNAVIKLKDITSKKAQNQKNYAKLLEYSKLILLQFLREGDKIYFPFSFDFRGRMYYKTTFSPTNFIYARYVFYYGFYSEEELNALEQTKNPFFDEIYNKCYSEILQVLNIFRLEKNYINVKTVFWILISIGKINIKKKEKINVLELIKEGLLHVQNIQFLESNEINFIKTKELDKNYCDVEDLENFFNDNFEENIFDLDYPDDVDIINISDKIELYHLNTLFNELKKKKIRKLVIQKDATASFIQNLIRLLGYKDEKSLEYANLLDNDNWYDPYSIILNDWIRTDKISKENLQYFNRKTIKKAIMTYPYSAKYITAFTYFKESVSAQFSYEINFGDKYEILFKSFYKFISKEMEEKFFLKNNSKVLLEITKELKKSSVKEFIIESHDSKTNLIYYKTKLKQFDLIIKIKKTDLEYIKRETKKYYDIDFKKIDVDKLSLAIRANWIHYIDGLLIRDINSNSKQIYVTIHDAVLVDFLNIENFLLNANAQINKKIFSEYKWNEQNEIKFFSIFLFI